MCYATSLRNGAQYRCLTIIYKVRVIAMFMRRFVVLWALVVFFVFTAEARAGGLNPPGESDGTGLGNSGQWFKRNIASPIQMDFGDSNFYFEAGANIVFPKLKIKKTNGDEMVSKNKAYTLPVVDFAYHKDADTVLGLKVFVPFGVGSAFSDVAPMGFDTDSIMTGTYVEPYVARRVTDKLTLGLGVPFVVPMLTWKEPFDINRFELPIDTDTRASAKGVGVGAEIGALYEFNDRLAIGIDYLSPIECDLKGRTEILYPISLRQEIETMIGFPDRLALSVGWKPECFGGNLLWVTSISQTGYSHNTPRNVTVDFINLGHIKKPVFTDMQDVIEVQTSFSYKMNENWSAGLGLSWMERSFPPATTNYATPDGTGEAIAVALEYRPKKHQNSSFKFGWSLAKGEGECRDGHIKATVNTVRLSYGIEF